ncbi:other/FunK1 protein kinase [Coprinopsis cinerea AmutBmut pab1-1]|nr:other/FunK1 protein kinase [Coprinopsis cinerea AmutBmut pab1-1]
MENEVSVCCFEDFFDNYLPNREVELEAVVQDLKKSKLLVARGRTSSKQRTSFPQTFKSFKSFFRSRTSNTTRVLNTVQTIGSAVRKALGRIADFEVNEYSVKVEGKSSPIAYGCITSNLEGPLRPTDIVAPIVAMPDDRDNPSEIDEDDTVFLSCAARIMHEDARRTFCYGITVQGPEATLWRFTRSLSVRSTPFDMTERSDLLIQFFVVLFGSRQHELGYDPLITLLPDLSYVYEIPTNGHAATLFYKTAASLCDARPSGISGRRLRVWEVEQVESAANPVRIPGTPNRVLKDVFLDSGKRTEADIQEEIFDDIAQLAQDVTWRSRPILKDFPPHDVDELGDALENGKFRQLFSCIIAKQVGEAEAVPESHQLYSTGESPGMAAPVVCRPKRRCLFVYEHICTPLNDIPALGDAVDMLKLVLTPLRLMFLAGWVHRDISPGNILAYREAPDSPWAVKLSDLEHAKRFPDSEPSGEDHIIGTPYFIAYEVHAGLYLYPRWLDPDTPCPTYDIVPVVHGYQNELESIWWILIWLVSMRINQNLPRVFAEKYFMQSVGRAYAATRANLFTNHLPWERELRNSLPRVLQDSAFYKFLNVLRHYLYVGYTNRNRDAKYADIASYSWIASEGMNKFFDGVKASREEWADIELMVDSEPRKVPGPLKDSEVQAAPASIAQPSPPDRLQHNAASSNKRQAVDSGEVGRASKRVRPNTACDATVAPHRSGPTTRSMARAKNEGRVTRSMTRRLQEEEKQEKL